MNQAESVVFVGSQSLQILSQLSFCFSFFFSGGGGGDKEKNRPHTRAFHSAKKKKTSKRECIPHSSCFSLKIQLVSFY